MKKILIIFVIALVWLYFATGRIEDLTRSISRHGFSELAKEPEWFLKWVNKKWDSMIKGGNEALEQAAKKREKRHLF